jgi:hypothetical protein
LPSSGRSFVSFLISLFWIRFAYVRPSFCLRQAGGKLPSSGCRFISSRVRVIGVNAAVPICRRRLCRLRVRCPTHPPTHPADSNPREKPPQKTPTESPQKTPRESPWTGEGGEGGGAGREKGGREGGRGGPTARGRAWGGKEDRE